MDCAQRFLPITFVPTLATTEGYEWPGSSWACVLRLTVLITALLAWVLCLGVFMNFNRLSLHSTYRNRLMRAYLGASNPDRHTSPDGETLTRTRQTDPYTGFDPADNVPMHHLRRTGCFSEDDLDGPAGTGRMLWHEVAAYWLDGTQDSGMREYSWNRMDTPDRQTVEDELKGARNDPCAQRVRPIIVKHLNKLLSDPKLISNSRFRSLEGPRSSLPQRADPEDVEIERAYRHRTIDGTTSFLNRLILEAECCRRIDVRGDGTEFRHEYPLKLIRRPQRPFHVVNMALNLVAGRNLAWQQRKAASFTVSPLHSGFYRGHRPTVEYGGGITLGTAMTISGAAATPNMGYHSSPAVTFLMTLFNARLGWWLGNPARLQSGTVWDRLGWCVDKLTVRPAADRSSRRDLDGQTYHLTSPRHSLRPLLDEALGRTSDDNEYVYLSDGGHFENLGLYEMVRRRCHWVVVVDATFDPQNRLEDLGNAIRKVRIDLGVPITFDRVPMDPRHKPVDNDLFCAVGAIEYPVVDDSPATDGVLIYLKPPRAASTSVDVYNYGRTRGLFPHESTANQWFSESQFESYRRLGQEIVDRICASVPCPASDRNRSNVSLGAFVDAVKRNGQGVAAADGTQPSCKDASDAAATGGAAQSPDPRNDRSEPVPNPDFADKPPKSATNDTPRDGSGADDKANPDTRPGSSGANAPKAPEA
jgi:hypothetical protein